MKNFRFRVLGVLSTLLIFIESARGWQEAGKDPNETPPTIQHSGTATDFDSPQEIRADGIHADGIQADGVIITWSEAKDELRGFSQKVGDWEVLKIDAAQLDRQQKITPVADTNIAAVRIGDTMAAFSGEKGWWDVIELSKGSTAVPVVAPSLAVCEDNGHLYTFAASKGRWSSPTDPKLASAEQEISLNTRGGSMGRQKFDDWLATLPAYKARGITLQTGPSGRLVLSVSRKVWMPETLQKIEECWGTSLPSDPGASRSHRDDPSSGQVESEISKLRAAVANIEYAVQDQSGQLRSPDVDQTSHVRELRKLVEQSFDLRQQLQELEMQRLRLKLQQVENNLAARAKAREAIIEGRLKELQQDKSGKSNSLIAGSGATANTNNPIGVSGPPHVPTDPRAGTVSHAVRTMPSELTKWSQPAEIVRQLRTLRASTISYMEQTRSPQETVQTLSQPLDQLIAGGQLEQGTTEDQRQAWLKDAQQRVSQIENSANEKRRDWNYAWSAYQTQPQLLRLDLDWAKRETESLTVTYEKVRQLTGKGAMSSGQLDEARTALEKSKINLQRVEHVLRLYSEIETSEPDLNPSSLSSIDPATSRNAAPELQKN